MVSAPPKIEVPKPPPVIQPTIESYSKSSDSQISQSLSSKTEFSSFSERKVVQDFSKTYESEIKSEQKLSTEPLSSVTTVRQEAISTLPPPTKETDYKIVVPPEIDQKVTEVQSETETSESGIQTTSISKQSSLQYFVKKIKEGGEESTVVKETIKTEPIKSEVYKKFEDVSKLSESNAVPKPKITTASEQISSETRKQTFSTELKGLNDIQLTPGPPPEICYIPKSETVKTKEEVSEKVKVLESQKDLPPSEIPRGGIKILPSPKPEAVPQESKSFSQHSESSFSQTKQEKHFTEKTMSSSFSSSYKTSETAYKPQTQAEYRTFSPKPSVEAIGMEKLWTAPKSPEIERPVSVSSYSASEKHVYSRPATAQSGEYSEVSTSAHEMEKAWAHKFCESHIEKSWPPPPQEEQKAPSWSVHSTLEKKWTPYETKTESKFIESVATEEQKPVPHYIANVSHSTKVNEQTLSKTEIVDYRTSKTEKEELIDSRSVKPSEIIKSWPPAPKLESYTPYVPPVQPSLPSLESLPIRPVSVQDITDEVYLEPGPPPEIGYAPPAERRQSYVEIIEQDLEKNLEKEPTRVLPGAVRTMPPPKEKYVPPPPPPKEKYVPPPPLPPKKEYQQPPPLPAKPVKAVEPPKKPIVVPSVPFERFPDLEPFPFTAEPEKPKPLRVAPPPTPSKFVKGKFTDSDYESDFEAVRFPAKWKPSTSDTESPTYRRVAAPKLTATTRSRSTESEPLPPSKFERPPEFEGPPRPVISFEDSQALRREASQQTKKQVKHYTKTHETRKEVPPPVQLKPGSPPIFVQPERKTKPESPKMKQKSFVDGYMADTDEPFIQQQRKLTKHEYKSEESSSMEYRQSYQSSSSVTESSQQKLTTSKPHVPHKVFQHKKHSSSGSSLNKVCAMCCVVYITVWFLSHLMYIPIACLYFACVY